jgi:bacillopeptidase F (M6 metalloprotease family)
VHAAPAQNRLGTPLKKNKIDFTANRLRNGTSAKVESSSSSITFIAVDVVSLLLHLVCRVL